MTKFGEMSVFRRIECVMHALNSYLNSECLFLHFLLDWSDSERGILKLPPGIGILTISSCIFDVFALCVVWYIDC